MQNPRHITVVLATLCLAGARALAAQTAMMAPPDAELKASRAVTIEQRALELQSDVTRVGEAARLHRWSAELRPSSDPEAVQSLALAAHLFGYAHQVLEARRTMELAADRALAIGDVEHAAQAYLEAAFFAEQLKQRSEVGRLGRKALLLASSPLLSDDQRKAITDRIRFDASLSSAVL